MERYPDPNDGNFQFSLAQMLEFRNLHNVDGLYPHQEFVRRFMSPYTPYTSLLMYHSLGSGKSIACIVVAVDHYLHDSKKCIIVTKGDSGTDNFIKQIRMFHAMSSRKDEWDPSIFRMKHYISLSNQVNHMSDSDIVSYFSNKILVLDEVHNVRYIKKVTESSVYGSILRILQLCHNIKIIMATATPMTDSHEQINSLLNICNYFREDNLLMSGIISYNSMVLNKPESTEIGTDEYVIGQRVYGSDMIGHQREVYKRENKNKPPDDIYRELTHISLFCFADGTHGRDVTDRKMFSTRHKTTITSMSTKQTKEIKYTKYQVHSEFANELSGESLRNSSSKYSAVVDLIAESDGNVFIFLEEVRGSGLLLLASILEHHGYEMYVGEDVETIQPKPRYTMCVGSKDICPNNNDRLDGFNSDLNKDGAYVRILLGSRVIGESITLKNVRQFYCLTPHWNDSTVDQAIGRVVRNGSHIALEEEKRHVNIYIHVSIFPDDPESSVDIKKLKKCKEKEKSIQKVTNMMIDMAVDKECFGSNEQIRSVTNFAATYLHNHLDDINLAFSGFFASHFSDKGGVHVDIDDLADVLDINRVLCKEAACRIIHSNTPVGSGFMRAYGSAVFLVSDPSLPYVMFPEKRGISARRYIPKTIQVEIPDRDVVEAFRYMPVKHKVAFLEKCIAENISHALGCIGTTYTVLDGIAYHFLLYRDLESSYTSVNPAPKKLLGKTRMFKDGTWSFAESEQAVINAYKSVIRDLMNTADEECFIYGIISTIDGDMRVRLRSIENRNKSITDNRYVRRGKNLKSIKKERLLEMLKYMGNDQNNTTSLSTGEIVDLIDSFLVRSGLYILI